MDSAFEIVLSTLAQKHQAMMAMTPITVDALLKSMPASGVYMFSEGNSHLYVGRTRRLRRRLIEHSYPKMLDAPFAFRLAREAVGKTKASYMRRDSRKALLADPVFVAARLKAIDRIRLMDIRYIEEDDPIRQTLLEIYVAVVTAAPYNEFKTS